MRELSSQPAIDLGRLAPSLGTTCGDYVRLYRAELERSIDSGATPGPGGGAGGVDVATRFTRTLDGLLSALYCASDAAARKNGHAPSGRVALAAVGGYGRRVVGPYSDVDVLFVCDDPADPHVSALAEGLLYPLWDCGLSIGHSVGGVDELVRLAREDLATATTLLDLRRVAGDPKLSRELGQAARRHVFEPALDSFLDSLAKSTADRHERFGGSLFLLEPEVKLGRGGLRDIDVAIWAARARFGGETTEDLVRNGALLARELEQLEASRELLWRIRNRLHLRAQRRHDRLTFADQEDIAEQLGFVYAVTSLGVEQFMQSYYRHARTTAQLMERVLERAHVRKSGARGKLEDLGDGTLIFDGHVTLAQSEQLASDPTLALRLYKHVAERKLPPYGFAREAIARAAESETFGAKLRESDEARRLFRQLVGHVGEVPLRHGSLLEELHDVGLVLAMIPEFEPITGRVQHDVYHVYTVDVHSIAAVDRLRALARGALKLELPFACRLATEAPRLPTLLLGALLHDIGKAGGRDHARKGASIARTVAERLGLSTIDVEHVTWLVEEHLSLYHLATRRDTSDPEVVSEVARDVGTVERLRDLFLLTVVDLSTTNPNALTAWKARVLEDLYLAVTFELEAGTTSSPLQPRAARLREEAKVGFVGDADEEALVAFVHDMPERYILANPVDVVRAHARIARDRGGATLHLALGPGAPASDVAELIVVTDDRPGLLADVSAVLAANRLDVQSAQIFTRPRTGGASEAFDVFVVRRAGRGGPIDAAVIERVQRDATALLAGETTATALLAKATRTPTWANGHTPEVPTEVIVDNAASRRFTVIDVMTRDRPGVLFAIARTLHEAGLTISLSKINTEGTRATDVFYVALPNGEKPSDAKKLEALAATLRTALGDLPSPAGKS